MPRFLGSPVRPAAAPAPAPVVPAAPLVSRSGDRWETEANRAAEAVSRTPAIPGRPPAPPARTVRPAVPSGALSGGQPLAPALRRHIEATLRADLGAVRVHTGPEAAAAAAQLGARAFARYNHIFLGAGQSPSDPGLMAHEATHTVQQTAVQNAAWSRGPPDSSTGSEFTISEAPAGIIQCNFLGDAWDKAGDVASDVGGAVVDGAEAVGGAVKDGAVAVGGAVKDAAVAAFWALVDHVLPGSVASLIHEIADKGLWDFLKEKISSAFSAIFGRLQNAGGMTGKLFTLFGKLLTQGKIIWDALKTGNCEPLFAALRQLGDTLSDLAGRAWDGIVDFLRPVGQWLENVWNKFGAPVVDFLRDFAGEVWDDICSLGKTLWDATKPLRDALGSAWDKIKEFLGIGQGSSTGNEGDGGGGVIGWIKDKAAAVWNAIKGELEPIITPIKKAGAAIARVLPIDAILRLRDRISDWMNNATAMADNMDQPGGVAENQDLLRDVILPGIRHAITGLRDGVDAASNWVTDAIGGLAADVAGFFGDLAGNKWLSPFRGALSWLEEEARSIGQWVADKVGAVFGLVHRALTTLDGWVEPVFRMLKKVAAVLGNLLDRLGDLVMGPLMLVPKCIREPIKDFLINRILKHIPVFGQLLEIPDLWAKVKGTFRTIIVQVFRDGDLFGAAWTFFKSVLSIMGVPPSLVTNLIRNAAKAIRAVLSDPIGFLGNVLGAMKLGLLNFVDHIGKHLLNGAVNWLLSGVKGAGVKLPEPFSITLRNVLDLVLQVLELTMEKIFQRIEKQKGQAVAQRVRKMVAAGEKIIGWVKTLAEEGPAGLWKELVSDLGKLWDTMLDMVIDYLVGKIVQQATIWVTKTLASGGLSVILDAVKAVYDALQTLAQYLKQLLEVANSVCEGIVDISKGVIAKAADLLEASAARLIPVMLSFLARTLGIGDLPVVIGEGIQKVRGMVESALDKLIDKTFAGAAWLKEKGQDAANAVLGWLGLRERIPSGDGQEHAIYVDPVSEGLMVASSPMDIDAAMQLMRAADPAETAKVDPHAKKAKSAVHDLQTKHGKKNPGNKESGDSNEVRDLTRALRGAMLELAAALGRILFDGDDELTDLPRPDFVPKANNSNPARSIEVKLSANHDEGTVPNGSPKGWTEITNDNITGKESFVQLHLINREFGGAGVQNNLVPGTKRNNSNHLKSVENPLKQLIGEKAKTPGKKKPRAVVWYSADVHYYTTGRQTKFLARHTNLNSSDFAESIDFKWGVYKRVKEGKKPTFNDKLPPVIGTFTLTPIPLPEG